MAKRTPKQQDDFDGIDVPVEVGKFVDGDQMVGLPISIDRKKLPLKRAEQFLCAARLQIQLCKDPNAMEDCEGQATFEEYKPDDVLSVVADVKGGFRTSRYDYAAKLSISTDEADKHRVLDFGCTKGRLRATRIGDAPDGRKKSENGDGVDTSDDSQGKLGLAADED